MYFSSNKPGSTCSRARPCCLWSPSLRWAQYRRMTSSILGINRNAVWTILWTSSLATKSTHDDVMWKSRLRMTVSMRKLRKLCQNIHNSNPYWSCMTGGMFRMISKYSRKIKSKMTQPICSWRELYRSSRSDVWM